MCDKDGSTEWDGSESEACMFSWAADHIQPITNALYSARLSEARLLHSKAVKILERTEDLPDEVREALGFYLLFIHYNIYWQEHPEDWNREYYLEVRRLFEQPATTRFGDVERLKKLSYIRFVADQDKVDPLVHDELMQLLDDLGDEVDDTVWFYVAGWAFKHNDEKVLERAYTELLIDPARWMGQAKWQRINIMYLLVAKRADRKDVEETIKTLTIIPQLIEFETQIWPRCIEEGLVDEELTAMFERRSEDVREKANVPQGYEVKTKRVRRDNG